MICIILCYVDGMVVLIYVDLYCSFLLVFMCGYIVGVVFCYVGVDFNWLIVLVWD